MKPGASYNYSHQIIWLEELQSGVLAGLTVEKTLRCHEPAAYVAGLELQLNVSAVRVVELGSSS